MSEHTAHTFRYVVAHAWRAGRARRRADQRIRTDGQQVWSYGHLIGETTDDGLRIAYDCGFSQTTATHCGEVCDVADEVRPCPDHGVRHGPSVPYCPWPRQSDRLDGEPWRFWTRSAAWTACVACHRAIPPGQPFIVSGYYALSPPTRRSPNRAFCIPGVYTCGPCIPEAMS